VEIFASEPSVPYSAPHEEWTILIYPSSEDLEVNDRPNEDWFSLVDAEREKDLLGRPIPQHLIECKNLQPPLILHY
jgi:hypothetical protein